MMRTHSSTRRRLAAVVIALAGSLTGLAAVAPPAVSATEAQLVSLAGCSFGDGTATVDAGVPISLRLPAFAQGTHGLILDFLLKERTDLTVVSGETTTRTDLTQTWPAPQQIDAHFWLTRPPNVGLGILAAGYSVLVTEQITFGHPLLVAFPPVGPSGDNGPFLTNAEDPVSCLITAQ
jgi:hypothetical protein